MKIGENVIRVRKEKNLRRATLVKRLRYIYGDNAIGYRTIERIERGDIAKGRLSSLLQLADAMDVDIEEFYKGTDYEDKTKQEELDNEIYIIKSNARGGIFRYNEKASVEILSPEGSSYVSLLLSLDPGAKTKLEQDPPGTIKFLFIINGEIRIVVGNLERVLREGDSMQFNSYKPHYFENRTKKKALALLHQSPKHF